MKTENVLAAAAGIGWGSVIMLAIVLRIWIVMAEEKEAEAYQLGYTKGKAEEVAEVPKALECHSPKLNEVCPAWFFHTNLKHAKELICRR